MNEYITKVKVIEAIEKAIAPEIITIGDHETIGVFTRESIKQIVSNLPTADVSEVILCKDCQYYQDAKTNKKGFLICPASGMEISETDYCSYGSRMSQENKHKVRCAKCRKIKEIVCTVDGKPWCEDCFDKAMGSGTKHETN